MVQRPDGAARTMVQRNDILLQNTALTEQWPKRFVSIVATNAETIVIEGKKILAGILGTLDYTPSRYYGAKKI